MKLNICHSNIIDDFLAERLDETQRGAFERHLDSCDACCEKLERLTAAPGTWQAARTFLSSIDSVEGFPGTTDPSTFHDAAAAIRLDFLGPTDDPHMLGRFAGYEISGVIGCGGMGIVLKGFDTALNRYAAIKVLAPHFATSSAARQRFAREAQAAAAVVHDNVVAIHGVAESSGLPYLVMPYIKGASLQKRLDQEGSLPLTETLRIATQTARGLAAAHDQGLVHRDIKPANILLPENVERVMITDFGLARAADDASLTRSGIIAGTPQYMSPEQARGESVDLRSDLFSLGSVIYTMCTGRSPFRAETPYGVLRRITDSHPRPINDLNPTVPLWFAAIIERLLAKVPRERYASAHEVADLLEDCLAHVQQPQQCPLPSAIDCQTPRRLWIRPITLGSVSLLCLIVAAAIGQSAALFSSADNKPEITEDKRDTATKTQNQKTSPDQLHRAAGSFVQSDHADLNWLPDPKLDEIERTLADLRSQFDNQTAPGPDMNGINR